jgi:hypothetical protein
MCGVPKVNTKGKHYMAERESRAIAIAMPESPDLAYLVAKQPEDLNGESQFIEAYSIELIREVLIQTKSKA